MLCPSTGNGRRNRQNYSSILSPQAALIAETWSASGPAIPFYPFILGFPSEQDTNNFMDANFADSGDGEIPQSFGAGAAVANEEDIFTNSISIDTDVSLNHLRRKRTSPVTPMSHAHPLTPALFPTQFSQSPAAPKENTDHSRVPSSSNPQPGVFDAFAPFPAELCISPSLTPSRQPQRVRSTSQNLQPPSQAGSSRNPSPRPSSSTAPARTDKNRGTESTDPPPKKKRRRQALSCTECKRRKIRCDRVQPCAPCKKRGEGDNCQWHILEPVYVKFLPARSDSFETGSLISSFPVPGTPTLVLTTVFV
jgi:hypothetical protein